jgi:hypothetical protein
VELAFEIQEGCSVTTVIRSPQGEEGKKKGVRFKK